ncbi:hypothetical protein ABZ816_23925 [Actinosynnema sp. NPDC047251]|uniref:Uncharacterized protein n=1 Tax=Saccharothrix espanaensis (strain ATCC 51144 / DSM 44229 / JCM 9112 / NBRC 15066 / NRRL 15764) TaxID=1179773 RepID=K0K6E3_SACES|nr:hypothetical protein [Saccharothrix espanaensis]CCH32479.1 hypothetical protein BN6_52140 [Saccharothrix espanaensis DSM 44229]
MRSERNAHGAPEGFVGDLLLELAREGRLVLSPEQADRVVAELERTLEVIRVRVRRAELSRRLRQAGGIGPEVDRLAVDAVFAGQIAADTWERALVELPKYVEAFRIASGRA